MLHKEELEDILVLGGGGGLQSTTSLHLMKPE